MSITDKLQTLKNTKQAIKQALINKGVEVSDNDSFASYVDKINTIQCNEIDSIEGLKLDNFISLNEDGKLTGGNSSSFTCSANEFIDFSMQSMNKGNVFLKTVSFPNLTEISTDNFFKEAFLDCENLEQVSFDNLTNISGSQTMYNTFANCNVTKVKFPKLISVSGSLTLWDTFLNCNLEEVQFPQLKTITGANTLQRAFEYNPNLVSISFPVLETLQGWNVLAMLCQGTKVTSLDFPKLKGCIYNTVFYNNTNIKKIWLPKEVTTIKATSTINSFSYSYSYSPFKDCSSDLVIYTDAPERLEGWSDYCFHIDSTNEATVVYGVTHEDFENETFPSSYPTLTINIPDGTTINGTYMGKEITSNTIKMIPNTSISLNIVLDGYFPLTKIYTIKDTDMTVTIDASEFIPIPSSLDLHYDYSGQEDVVSTFIDNINYKIDATNTAITNIPSTSDNKTGYYGYVVVKPTVDVELNITYKYNYYSTSYTYGCHSIYVGSQIYQPTNTQIYNNTKDGYGEYLERGYGSSYYKNGSTSSNSGANTLHTVTTTLNAGETYYINFAATKYSNTYQSGTFAITDIITTPIE